MERTRLLGFNTYPSRAIEIETIANACDCTHCKYYATSKEKFHVSGFYMLRQN